MSMRQLPAASDSCHGSHTHSTVALLETDDHLQSLIEMLLRREGYLVVTLPSRACGEQREEVLSADLLIVDLVPGPVGAAAISSQLRELPAESRLPVLIVSSYSEAECRARLPNLDAAGYVPKPFRNRDLMAAVHRLIPRDGDRQEEGRCAPG